MDSLGAEVGQKMRSAIKAKLLELKCYVDDELPDYIMVMVANRRTKTQMKRDLDLFLNTKTEAFVDWLHIVLKKLKEVTVTNPEIYKLAIKENDKQCDVNVKNEKSDADTSLVKKESDKTVDPDNESSNEDKKVLQEKLKECDVLGIKKETKNDECGKLNSSKVEQNKEEPRNVSSKIQQVDSPTCTENSMDSQPNDSNEAPKSERQRKHSPIIFDCDKETPKKSSVLKRLGKKNYTKSSDYRGREDRYSSREKYKRSYSESKRHHTNPTDRNYYKERNLKSIVKLPETNSKYESRDKLKPIDIKSKIYVPEKPSSKLDHDNELKVRQKRFLNFYKLI